MLYKRPINSVQILRIFAFQDSPKNHWKRLAKHDRNAVSWRFAKSHTFNIYTCNYIIRRELFCLTAAHRFIVLEVLRFWGSLTSWGTCSLPKSYLCTIQILKSLKALQKYANFLVSCGNPALRSWIKIFLYLNNAHLTTLTLRNQSDTSMSIVSSRSQTIRPQ